MPRRMRRGLIKYEPGRNTVVIWGSDVLAGDDVTITIKKFKSRNPAWEWVLDNPPIIRTYPDHVEIEATLIHHRGRDGGDDDGDLNVTLNYDDNNQDFGQLFDV